ncbi:MAG: TonB-dependent receptor [Bacteroides sp.]|nr:TonB-dependent receptor [Bacteroides sp.]MCM1412976.1 TonB-dependent receptor [Bacteroides sp.]MCM1471682.1 TonB-dependent receptor [Bacteroides sp.]
MNIRRTINSLMLLMLSAPIAYASADSINDLEEVVVTSKRGPLRMSGASNSMLITASELKRAACCNLGESFTTNPSVDVNYNDAATGARQIRLLGLSGSYVQMLTENVPNFRGAAAPYGLGYIPGPWMQSIQVSKGASSVKNGYESITGQINVEMKKPQLDPSLSVNMYYDMMNKLEANFDGNLHLGSNWSAGLLTHFENGFSSHDGNDDGFSDIPRVRQFSIMPRVAYLGSAYVFQASAKFLDERRLSGQDEHHATSMAGSDMPLYKIRIDTRRWEAMTKNAYIFDRDNDGNIALIVSGSLHDQDAGYGLRICDIDQREAYAQLMFERKWSERHALSAGLTMTFDDYHYRYRLQVDASEALARQADHETVGGGYGQYTFNLDDRLIAMAGLRYDRSNRYGSMVTPRMHVRYKPVEQVSLHMSAGRGFRSPHPLAEYSYLLASSRRLVIAPDLQRESAWNFGAGATWDFTIADKKLTLDGEYYYTRFTNQLMVNLDRDPHAAYIYSYDGLSYSHAVQVELSASPLDDLTLTAAWRLTDVKANYGNGMEQKPLTSRNKGLFTLSYAPMMGLWQFDASLVINGGGRMPNPYRLADGAMSWREHYGSFVQLNAQLTRNFRHWSIYVGGENLTGFKQKNPIIGASNPWGVDFDATMIYGPLHGAMVYVGFRYNFTKYN